MTVLGYVKDGRILLDEPARLPEGTRVQVLVVENGVRVSTPPQRLKLPRFEPVKLPGGSMANELVRDRR